MQEFYPLKLSYVTKSPIWSGDRLKKEWNRHSDSKVGESWELSVREGERSVIENGSLQGRTLYGLIEEYSVELMGKETKPADVPLLVKFIDSADDLSVQVHPDDSYASRVENDRGKTEMWYIVDAAEGARIVCGLRDGADVGDLAKAVEDGKPESVLNYSNVKAGETYFIPAGLPHAIGKGILIAEIQQNCDLTYRVYDYGRLGTDGKPRELHVKKALDVIRHFTEDEIRDIRYSRGENAQNELLANCEYFRVERVTLSAGGEHHVNLNGGFCHLLVLDGAGEICCDGKKFPFAKGDSYFLPACLECVSLRGEATLLLSFANK